MIKKIILLYMLFVINAYAESMCEKLDFISYNSFEQDIPLSKKAIINSLKDNKGGIILDVKSLKDNEVAIYPSYNTSDFTFLKNKRPRDFTEQQWLEIKLLDKQGKVSTESVQTAKELFNYFYTKDKTIKIGFYIKSDLTEESLKILASYANIFPNVYFIAFDGNTLNRIRKYYTGYLGIWVGSPGGTRLDYSSLSNMVKKYGNIGLYYSESRQDTETELVAANRIGIPFYFVQNSFFTSIQEPYYKNTNGEGSKIAKSNFNLWLDKTHILPTGMVVMENKQVFCP